MFSLPKAVSSPRAEPDVPGQGRSPPRGRVGGASLPGSQLLDGAADLLCSFFKFFLLTRGLLCLEIKKRLMKSKQQLPNHRLLTRPGRLGPRAAPGWGHPVELAES